VTVVKSRPYGIGYRDGSQVGGRDRNGAADLGSNRTGQRKEAAVVNVRAILCIVCFPICMRGFLHILHLYMYIYWPLASWKYKLHIPNMVSEILAW
jgi:hypothetical protein